MFYFSVILLYLDDYVMVCVTSLNLTRKEGTVHSRCVISGFYLTGLSFLTSFGLNRLFYSRDKMATSPLLPVGPFYKNTTNLHQQCVLFSVNYVFS